MTQQSTLRERLMALNGYRREEPRIKIPVKGRIDSATVRRIQKLAERARCGDIPARDQLFWILWPRLDRIGFMLKPWPNTIEKVGIWDRGDVRQETWLVFVELLGVWDGDVPFVSYLLARFQWRLRDRILRGIGKPQTQFGSVRVSEVMLAGMVFADEDEEPESAAMAKRLLERLMEIQMTGGTVPKEAERWPEFIGSPEKKILVSPDYLNEEDEIDKRSRVA